MRMGWKFNKTARSVVSGFLFFLFVCSLFVPLSEAGFKEQVFLFANANLEVVLEKVGCELHKSLLATIFKNRRPEFGSEIYDKAHNI
jgi:hypothetical protein